MDTTFTYNGKKIKTPTGARRATLGMLRVLKKRVEATVQRWNVPSYVYIHPEDRTPGENVWKRPRTTAEYPENQAAAWRNLAQECQENMKLLNDLHMFACAQARVLEGPSELQKALAAREDETV